MKNTKTKNSKPTITSAPSAVTTKTKGAKQPKIVNHNSGATTVSHMEYVTDVTTTIGPYVRVSQLNPQRASLFPWLSAIATRFEMYKFDKLKFHFKPSCGTNTNGYVILAFDFDVLDQGAADSIGLEPTKSTLLGWKYSSKTSPWSSGTLDVSPDSRLATWRYCNNVSPGDARLDMLGNFVLSIYGDAINFIGEIFVEYSVTFRQPSIKDLAAPYANLDSGQMSVQNEWFPVGVASTGTMQLKRVDNDSTLITQAGSYLVDMVLAGHNITQVIFGSLNPPADSPKSRGTATQLFADFASNSSIVQLAVDVTVPPMQLNFGGTTGDTLRSFLKIATWATK